MSKAFSHLVLVRGKSNAGAKHGKPLGWSHRDTTADALRTRYLRVGLGNGLNAYLNVGRIGRDAPPILVLQGAAMVVAASLRAFVTGTEER